MESDSCPPLSPLSLSQALAFLGLCPWGRGAGKHDPLTAAAAVCKPGNEGGAGFGNKGQGSVRTSLVPSSAKWVLRVGAMVRMD